MPRLALAPGDDFFPDGEVALGVAMRAAGRDLGAADPRVERVIAPLNFCVGAHQHAFLDLPPKTYSRNEIHLPSRTKPQSLDFQNTTTSVQALPHSLALILCMCVAGKVLIHGA